MNDPKCKGSPPTIWGMMRMVYRLANGKCKVASGGLVMTACCEEHLLEASESPQLHAKLAMAMIDPVPLNVRFMAVCTKIIAGEEALTMKMNADKLKAQGNEGI
jgi:hypothetical protein